MTEQTSLVEYIHKPDNIIEFERILGKGAEAYVQSVAISVKDNPALQECTYDSIVNAALRSASLGLSCDPSLRQAYIIPRSKKVNGSYIKVASFQPHYNGLYNLAQRTGKYRCISVNPIYEGETVFENVQSGLHTYSNENSQTLLAPDKSKEGLHTGYRNVTSGKNVNRVIGYLGYFKTNKGFEKTIWMTVEEIEKHAKNYSDSYSKDFSAWKDPKKHPTMQMKTVLIALLKWADLSGSENALLTQALEAEAEDTIEGETTSVEYQPEPVSETVAVEEVVVGNLNSEQWADKLLEEYNSVKGDKVKRNLMLDKFKTYEASANMRLVKDLVKLEECYNEVIKIKTGEV